MSAVDRAAQGWAAAQQVRQNPYVSRVLSDPELRDNARVAFGHAQKAFQRIQASKAPASALLDDQKLHAELRTAQTNLTAAITALREGPVKKKKHRLRRLVLLSIVTAGVALVVSEGLRNKALDLLFGAEEEFDYTSTTVASTPPPAAPVAPVAVNGDAPETAEATEPAAGGTEEA
jgi:hypothetical protein